ncbi:hypothetical protein GGF44_003174 [Coemansia sp. RSA 1694]|nr:hypothetical protein GGF44_003174 [Coemansia sp. RSA 1694]
MTSLDGDSSSSISSRGSWWNVSPDLGSEVSESAVSESSVQSSEEYGGAGLDYRVASLDRTTGELLQARYRTALSEHAEHQGGYGNSTTYFYNGAVGDIDIVDDGDVSGEEAIAMPSTYARYTPWELHSDFSPGFDSVVRAGMAASLKKPASLPPQLQTAEVHGDMWNAEELCTSRHMYGQPVQPSSRGWHASSPAVVSAAAASGLDQPVAGSGGPVVFKPRPVAPHVFFECDGAAPSGRGGYGQGSGVSGMAFVNGDMREHSDRAMRIPRDEYEDDDDASDRDSICSGESPHHPESRYRYMLK